MRAGTMVSPGIVHRGSAVPVGVIEIQKLPVLNQGQGNLAITMSGKKESIMGRLKTIIAVVCDEPSTLMVMQYFRTGFLGKETSLLLTMGFVFAFSSYWFYQKLIPVATFQVFVSI